MHPGYVSGTKGDITVGNDVWIGAFAIVLSGVTIGDGAVVGAAAVVAKDVPPYAVVVGNPARVVKHRFDPDMVAQLLAIRWWDWPEDRVKTAADLIWSDRVAEFVAQYRAGVPAENIPPLVPTSSLSGTGDTVAPHEPARPPAPAFSVVMPVYNGTRFLDRAINSLRRQTFAAWELLVVDDASTDASAARLDARAAADPRIRVFRHPDNRGPSAARNTALRAARGEWIAYLDCDDEFAPDHLAQAHGQLGDADVLMFRYDVVEERPGHPHFGRTTTHDPATGLHRIQVVGGDTIAVPLGVIHRKELLDRAGYFDESLGRFQGQSEDADLWRRFARVGARIIPVPAVSGRYHVRADSLARARPPAPATVHDDSPLGGVWVDDGPEVVSSPGLDPRVTRPRVMFASYHCYQDPTGEAALCARDLFTSLTARGWICEVFTGPALDDPSAPPIGFHLRGRPGVRTLLGTAGPLGFSLYSETIPGGLPVTVFASDPPAAARPPSTAEAKTFLAVLKDYLEKFRPDVVLTNGHDLASAGIATLARRAGAKVGFWLNDFTHPDPRSLGGYDAVIVPSEFSRVHHRALLGIDCVVLPPVIDPIRVTVDRTQGREHVTFVSPEPTKGVFWFARIADVLGRSRPDIPLQIVAGSSQEDWINVCGVNRNEVPSIRVMANAPNRQQFFHRSKLILMPSVVQESFGRVEVEAMLNGIPVIASDRGALPEVVGAGGKCIPIPTQSTADTRTLPTTAEVEKWVAVIIRLWDNPTEYSTASEAARKTAIRWHPDVVVPRWEKFLAHFPAVVQVRPL
ncbi:Acetyltransferase [Fimbriiglobus ruber]|uniref:Acetyltransferase n=2 Tax=Fimbriiglobus ruber TaxID=1908690 RepID=A0A225DHR0_9BACT|nr:Acetyltransferase [Fimbriiglobus ruber]